MTTTLPINGYMDTTNASVPLAGQQNGASNPGGSADKGKEWQMELLMEKLRSKAASFKSLVETAKSLRSTILEKRFAIDSVEKMQLQKCLDTLQHSIKVTSFQSMVERLESLTRQLGLKFMMSGPQGNELFISSDMFFLEVILEPSGAVKNVKIHHEGKNEQQNCEELVACLSRGDFVDFTVQLEGLVSIYQLNADKKVKCKAFSALQSLEADLGVLAQLQTFMKEPFNLVHKSPVGILERRRGGHAMKLTYFVSPYDLIDQENRSCETLSLDAVISRKIGHSVTVCLEGSTAHKLPTSSIITVSRSSSGKSTPSYAVLTSTNSSILPACFVLKLAKKMPMCLELLQKIQKVTELECTDVSTPYPLLSMIVQHTSNGQLDCQNNRGLYVSLPDQHHCYFMTENKDMEGVLVGSIPFTHPAHVPQILVYLRQQALFNTLVSSCVRSMARQDPEHTTIFEVSALSWQSVSVSLEHPFEETMATALLDLTDISALKCKLYGVSLANTEQTSEIVGKILQRCLSIPLTMRTLIKIWEGRNSIGTNITGGGNGNFNINLGSGRDQNAHNGSGIPDFGSEDVQIKQEPGTINGSGSAIGRQQMSQQHQQSQQNHQQQQSFLDAGTESSIGFPSFSGQSDTTTAAMLNPLQLGALLGQAKMSTSASNTSNERSKKSRKRKTADGSWRSPKRKAEDSGEILLESSSSDSTPLGTPTSSRDNTNETRTPTPTSAISLASGLEISNIDSSDILGTDKSSDYDLENENDVMEVHEVQNVEDLLKKERKSKKREEKKSPTSSFEESKSLVPPSVSITPISSSGMGQTTNYSSVLTGMGLERRPGIEIIPITSSPQTNLPSSITITPIAGPTSKSSMDERRERKSSKNRSGTDDGKSKLEKKKKRKREESPMGPPDKFPPKQQQDPLSKPVSVSIKPTESPPGSLNSSRPSSPATTLRKFSPSPTHTSPLALVGKSSPTLKQPSSKPIQSPKHSPVYSSPKHMSVMPASVSPKHGTSSPKHGSSGSAGKPSMSALKSAASSPSSGKSDVCTPSKCKSSSSSSSSSKESSREKDRKASLAFSSSSGHQSPKSKSSCGKPKQLESLSNVDSSQQSTQGNNSGCGSTTPPSELNKSVTAQQQARNRKGSLSAVIDKLKNAQHCTDDGANGNSKISVSATSGSSGGSSGQKERSLTNKVSVEGKSANKNPSVDSKNPGEYMVKHSSDGMKITINKTRTKDSKMASSTSSSSSSSGNGSPKTHTGLKPGVSSGPASKKPSTQTSPKVHISSPLTCGSSASSNKMLTSSQKFPGIMKSSSGSNLTSSGSLAKSASIKSSSSSSNTGSPKTSSSGATDLSRSRDKSRFPKSNEKSIFSSKGTDIRKSSPSSLREECESERAFKLLAHASMSSLQNLPGIPPQLLAVEGLMKQLDTNFQIPKLSARVNADSSDKRSSASEKISQMSENVSKSGIDNKTSDQMSRSSQLGSNPITSLSNTKSEESLNTPVNFGTNTNSSGLMLTQSQAVSHDSDVPTNLSMQSDDNQSKSDLINRSFLNSSTTAENTENDSGVVMVVLPKLGDSHSVSGKQGYGVSSSGMSVCDGVVNVVSNSESLNLSTKPLDAAISKYTKCGDEKEAQQSFQVANVTQLNDPTATITSTTGATSITSSQEAAEMLLDFSAPKEGHKSSISLVSERASLRRNTPPPPPPPPLPPPPPPPPPPSPSLSLQTGQVVPTPSSVPGLTATTLASVSSTPNFPSSPSVSVHIVKSPAPSPRVIPPSPHSASPCITDDELMDEALVGMGK